jgi:hypothetical protein
MYGTHYPQTGGKMKTYLAGATTISKPFDHPFLTGMGSTVDLLGFTFEKVNLDLSTGFQRDAKAIWNNFVFVGMDIQKSTEAYQAPLHVAEK